LLHLFTTCPPVQGKKKGGGRGKKHIVTPDGKKTYLSPGHARERRGFYINNGLFVGY